MPEWYYLENQAQRGPVKATELRQLALEGRVPPRTLVWRPGMPVWLPLDQQPELVPPSRPPASPMPPSPEMAPPPISLIPAESHQPAPLETVAEPPVGRLRLGRALGRGYDVFCMHDWKAMFMVLYLVLIWAGLAIVGATLENNVRHAGTLLLLFLQGYFAVGVWRAGIALADREHPPTSIVFPPLRLLFMPGLASLLVYGVIAAATLPLIQGSPFQLDANGQLIGSGQEILDAFKTGGGRLLYLMAACLLIAQALSALFSVWPALVTDRGRPSLIAVVVSLRYTLPNLLKIMLLQVLLCLALLMGACFLLVGAIPVLAYIMCVMGVAYRQMAPRARRCWRTAAFLPHGQ